MAGSDARDRSPLLHYGSDSEGLPTRDFEARGINRRRHRGTSRRTMAFVALNGIALLAVAGICVSMHNAISRLETELHASHQFANRFSQVTKNDEFDDTKYDHRIPAGAMPSKFAVDFVTPRKDQAVRGTCWDFASIGLLEQSYRENGVRNGWLQPDEYVAFSEQAYGVEVMELCTGPPDSQQQINCRVAGDSMWENSTEGGEIPELYYLQEGLAGSVFPYSVCPYFTKPGNDSVCPGLEEARATNPLKFKVTNMETRYDDISVKEMLFRKNKAMGLSTAVTMVTHYYPCIGSFKNDPHCQPETCTLCPPDLAMSTCCIPLKGGPNRNMEGEFFSHRGMSIEGGHAMLLVGYNDAFMTRDGFTGGLIVKNSWADGPRQGSHSLKFWMQEVSDWEERTICPNSHNPFNWYQCGNNGINDDDDPPNVGGDFNRSNAFNEGIKACLAEETRIYADVNLQPLHLRCIDETQCNTAKEFTYFVRNTTDWGDRMTVMCLWEYSEPNHVSREICLKPMLELDIAKTLRPYKSEVRQNDPDRCGFYFIPYVALRQWIAQFQGFYVNNIDIEWDPQSYLANSDSYPDLDYTLLKKATKTQHSDHFDGPFPYAKVIRNKK